MKQSEIADAAMLLLHLRTQRRQIASLPRDLAPRTIADAYAIQEATHRLAGWPIEMHKVGCTSEAARVALGIWHPIAGQVPVEGVFASGDTVPRSFLAGTALLECEIALQVDGVGRIIAVAPAIELVNSRFSDMSKAIGISLIADNSAGAGAVLGTPIAIDRAPSIDQLAVTLCSGENEIVRGSTRALVDGPRGSVPWLLEHHQSRGNTVADGTWILTGTCTGLTPTRPATSYTADFGPLGLVSLHLE